MPDAPRTKAGKRAKVKKVLDEYKAGELHSGSSEGPVVTNRRQAIAIALSESGQSRRKTRKRGKKRSLPFVREK